MKWTAKWLRKSVVAGGVGVYFIISSASLAQGRKANLIQSSGYGEVDWGIGRITARGIGLEVARQNLWKVIKGVRVDNHRLVGELISRNADLKEQLQRIIQQAKAIEEKGVVSGQTGIRLQLSLKGPFTEALLAGQPVGNSSRPPGRFGPPTHNPAPTGPMFKLGPTGLVVDARGLGVEPALAPQILSDDGREIYGLAKASRSYAVHQGLVEYMRDVAIAEANQRMANNPIVVRALQVAPGGHTDLIISSQDADRINQASQQHDFLYKCRVIIVID